MATSLSLNLVLVLAWVLLGGGAPVSGLEARLEPTRAPGPLAEQYTPCLQPGSVNDIAVPTQHLPQREIRALVYLPPCYDARANPGYPLVVLLHGQGYTPQQWLEMNLPRRADALIATGDAAPFVVLMPYEPLPALPPSQTGFDEAFLQDLLPWMRTRYALRDEREFWAVGGISRGGAWAIHFGLGQWQRFGAIGGHSPAVFWSDGLQIPRWLEAIPEDQWPRIYLDIGDKDRGEIMRAVWDFETLLTDMGVPHQWRLNVGRHEQAYWDAHLEDYLRWYAAAWRPAATGGPSPTPEEHP